MKKKKSLTRLGILFLTILFTQSPEASNNHGIPEKQTNSSAPVLPKVRFTALEL